MLRYVWMVMLGLSLCGCARISPLSGVWSGQVQVKKVEPDAGFMGMATNLLSSQLKGPCILTLKDDGTGFLKVAQAPERPIAWSEEGEKIILSSRGEPAATPEASSSKSSDTSSASIVGTLSADKQSLSLDLGIAQIALKRDTTK